MADLEFINAQRVPGNGLAFAWGNKALVFVEYRTVRAWDDASDEWTWQHLPGCRPATVAEQIEAGLIPGRAETTAPAIAKRFAIKAGGYYAIAGKRQSSAITTKQDKASTWATREAAELAIAEVASDAPGFFGPIHEPHVTEI